MKEEYLVFTRNNMDIKLTRGIYFLFKNHELIYIGQSEDIFKRVPIHLGSKDFNNWNYIEYENENLNNIEAEFILKFQPKQNKAIPKNDNWISASTLKLKFGISKVTINKMIKNQEIDCIIFNNVKYVKGLSNEI